MIVLRLLALLLLSVSVSARDLRVGAFNIQIFGVTKASKPEVMDILVKIIRRYDLLLIQEIRDSSNTAIHNLLNRVNEGQSEPFDMVLSERLGRSVSKEQYAYFYKPDAGLRVEDKYVYQDTKIKGDKQVDLFEREPFVVSFSSDNTLLESFSLVGIHIDPDRAFDEIIDLQKYVFGDVQIRTRQANVMVLGDLNADCTYVNKGERVTLRKDGYTWLIGDEVDTTVKGSHCAYDRFITTGSGWKHGIVPGSAKVYRFDQDSTIGAVDYELAKKVSDHFPIEFLLAAKKYTLTVLSDSVYIKLAGDYEKSGSLPSNELYEIDVIDEVNPKIVVLDEKGVIVAELDQASIDDKLLAEVIRSMMLDNTFVYIKPIKNRYSGKQKSEMIKAEPVYK